MCTPIGSRFSIEHTTTTLSARSRMSSSSNSSQPRTDSSTSTCPMGDSARPRSTWKASIAGSSAKPPPCPPRVKAGRTTAGRETSSSSASEVTIVELGTSSPHERTASRNSSRSSARRMTSTGAPISSTPRSSSTPASASETARLRAVCPPSVGSSASGRSRSSTELTLSRSSGSMYVRSAKPGSVMIVAGFELTTIVR